MSNPDDGDIQILQRTPSPPEMEELQNHEFPQYFGEVGGRLYASHQASPYPLPVDTPELERQKVVHTCLQRLLGSNYVGPVDQALAPVPNRQKLALDFGCGTGKWLEEMAAEFPQALFAGLDIVPIATRYPADNLRFELEDINDRTRWGSRSVDFVHARFISMATRDYRGIINEVARILRPGGLFFSGEWTRATTFHPNYPTVPTPALDEFYGRLTHALNQCVLVVPVSDSIPGWLATHGSFENVTGAVYFMPIGDWPITAPERQLGRAYRAAFIRFMDSVKPLLVTSGMAVNAVSSLYEHVIEELEHVEGLVSAYCTVYAHKV